MALWQMGPTLGTLQGFHGRLLITFFRITAVSLTLIPLFPLKLSRLTLRTGPLCFPIYQYIIVYFTAPLYS